MDVELIQQALAVTVDLRNARRGTYDGQTRSAFANFQRSVGYVGDDATGIPDPASLELLAIKSGMFRVP
jgi:peptidoglycan hydrolase-like protein with peptidoglycan-binding domain